MNHDESMQVALGYAWGREDASKIKTELGWTPTYLFKRGIRETIQWYLKNQAWVERVTKQV